MVPSVPSEFFIFVNRSLPMTRHNFEVTRTFTSRFADLLQTPKGEQRLDRFAVDPMPFKQNPDQHPTLSPFAANLTTELWIEWEAERVRRDVAPQAPGRLSALYASETRRHAVTLHSSMGGTLRASVGSR